MIWKVVAVMINVGTPVCGPGTESRCSATFEEGMISEKSYHSLEACQNASVEVHQKIVDHGWSHNTFCARMK